MSFSCELFYYYRCDLSTPALADGFSLESEWQQVPRTLLSILVNLNNAVVWIVSSCPPISKSSSLLTKHLRIVLSAPITVAITVSFMFHKFFSSLANSKFLSLLLFSLIFTLWSAMMAKFTMRQVLCFVLTITRSGLICGSNKTVWHLNWVQTNDLC